MSNTRFVVAIVVVFLVQSAAHSQSQDPPKFEVAGEFTTLQRDTVFRDTVLSEGKRTAAGLGGRFTYNLNSVFSVEGAAYFFPEDCFECDGPGDVTEIVGGIKVGKRFDRWGVFAKVRPGIFYHDSHFGGPVTCLNITCPFPIEDFEVKKTHFAVDIGGVVEFYPSRRIVTRFDAGDTIVKFRGTVTDGAVRTPTGGFAPFPFVFPGRTSHNFQFIAGVGFRF
jgi:hypothetical protein